MTYDDWKLMATEDADPELADKNAEAYTLGELGSPTVSGVVWFDEELPERVEQMLFIEAHYGR